MAAGCIALSLLLRFLGFKPDPIHTQVKKETALKNAYYSRKTKDQLWAIHQPSNPINAVHNILLGIAFLCIWYILLVGLIYIVEVV
jgi:hypothetical protein